MFTFPNSYALRMIPISFVNFDKIHIPVQDNLKSNKNVQHKDIYIHK